MAIDPVKIPQNVYVEDRIIGPITLRQIMITMISAGISYAIWAMMRSAGPITAVQTTLAWIPLIIGVLFAFIRINGISLLRILLLTLEKLDKPSRRVWSPRTGIYINIVTKPMSDTKQSTTKAVQRDPSHIQELSTVLDQGPEEISVEQIARPVDDIRHFHSPPSHA